MRPALILLLALALLGASGAARAEPYRLGPSDRLLIRVVIWDGDALRFVPWDAVSGEYAVAADGAVMVPLAGAVPAEGRGVADLSRGLAAALQERVRLVEPPEVAVEIVEHRPFFVLGDVERPGDYPARPGLVAAQALAIAGGIRTVRTPGADPLRPLRDAGALREAEVQAVRALAQEARLEAELAGAEDLEMPEGLRHPGGPEALNEVLGTERAILRAEREALEREAAALRDLQSLLGAEIEGLEAKLEGRADVLRLARETLANVEALAERGLTRAPQVAAAQQSVIELEGSELDLRNLVARARQRISEAERDLVGLRARRTARAAERLQSVRADIYRLAARRGTLARVLASGGAPVAEGDGLLVTRYEILRRDGGGEPRTVAADASTPLRPGDVLTVRLLPSGEAG